VRLALVPEDDHVRVDVARVTDDLGVRPPVDHLGYHLDALVVRLVG